MSFGQPHAFWLIGLVAALALVDQLRRHSTGRQWPNILRLRAHATNIECPPPVTNRDRRWRLWLGLALLVAAGAAPRAGHVRGPVERPPREVVVALDLSRSMLARDVKPSRLDHAKLLAAALAQKSVGDRLGLVLFSSTAYLQLPLSTDYEILTEMLPNLSPAYFPRSGTNFGAMLAASLTAFSKSADIERFLVVLSDGEAFDSDWKSSLDELKQRGIHVIAIGIGTKTGDLIVTEDGALKNSAGSEVVSRLNTATLEELAGATGGVFAKGDSWVDIQSLLRSSVAAAAKPVVYKIDDTQLVERYRWIVLPALILLGLSFWLEFPVKPSMRQVQLPTPASRETEPGQRREPVATAVATVAAMLALLLAPMPRLHSQDVAEQRAEMESDPRSPLRSLSGLVSQRINGMLAKREPNANDCVSLVIDIIAYGENTLRARQRFPVSIIDDANKAIDWGERLDPQGGAWNKLRGDLQLLLKADTEPWKTARPDAAGKVDLSLGFDPNTEMKNDRHASGLHITNTDTSAADPEETKGTFADSPAFGDMSGTGKNAVDSDEPAPETDQQVVGGKKSSADAERDRHPELVLPLQKLELVRRNDTPAKLFQMLEGKRNAFVAPSPEW